MDERMDIAKRTKTLVRLLRESGRKIILAESCTGGLIAKTITDIAGSSEIFYGSMVVYDNLLKEKLLDVSQEILENYGAVSAECALAMVRGLFKTAPADYAASVTGIAGPGGGTETKPVGLVYMGFGTKDSIWVCRFHFTGNRETIRRKTLIKFEEMLWEHLSTGTIDFKKLAFLKEVKRYPLEENKL